MYEDVMMKPITSYANLKKKIKNKNERWRDVSAFKSTLLFFSEALNSVPSMHGRQLTTACNSSSGGSTGLFWLPWAPASTQTHRHMQTDTLPPYLPLPVSKINLF